MSSTQIEYCPITDQKVANVKVTETYIEYSILYNGSEYTLLWAIGEEVDSKQYITTNEKVVLQSMFYNKEWPVEKETPLSKEFISQLIRLGEYPVDFPEKLNYYLLKCYLNGGKEYSPLLFDARNRLEAYCKDENEFSRIIKGLTSKKLINLTNTNEFSLTEEGIKQAEELNQIKLSNEPSWPSSISKPRITIIAIKDDSFYVEKMKNFFAKYNIGIVTYDGIDDVNGFSSVSNIKGGLYSNETDYVIFIKSQASDRNNAFGSILDIAIEAHENTDKRKYKYIYIAFIDDSKAKTRPRIDNYHSNYYDFRITTNRKRLGIAIQKDWEKRISDSQKTDSQKPTRKFNFPEIVLNEEENFWLSLLYENFISGKEPHYSNFISLHWKILSKDFDPSKINSLLAEGGSNITLYGIWAIDPFSKYIRGVEDVIFAIKAVLEEKGNPDEITGELLLPKLNYPPVDVVRCLRLLSRLGGFMQWYGGNDDGTGIRIKIQNENELNQFKTFISLEKTFYSKYEELLNNGNTGAKQKNKKSTLNEKINLSNIHLFKTKFSYRDTNNIKPVMGVTELSDDLAEIIDTLPIQKEKGQMIGVFGKWGRGKTFLLKELWNVLSKKQFENKKVYTKIEYHAWKYQETPASWAYLYEKFVAEFLGRKKGVFGGIKYYGRLLDLNYERLGAWPMIKLFFALTATIVTPVILGIMLKWYYSIAIIPIVLTAFLTLIKKIYKEFSTKAIDLIKLYSIRHSYKEVLGIQADIQDELIKLLKVWIPECELGKRKILLVVEDIDRCTEDRIIQNIDALRVLLEDEEICKRVIIITAIDERILKNAIRMKYDSILKANNSRSSEDNSDIVSLNELTSEYLDKLFISAIKLGGLTGDQRAEYINELLEQEIDREKLKEHDNKKKETKLKSKLESSGISDVIADALSNDSLYKKRQELFKQGEDMLSQAGINSLDLAIKDGDFVIIDGDIGLQDDRGNITSMPQIENTINERIKNQNRFEKISPIEVDLIREIVNKWTSATPRRVRIFYYRYLLSKNLLINKYDALKRINPWQDKEGVAIMMQVILNYTKAHNPDLISNEKIRVLASTEEKIELSIINETITLYKIDYLFLLEVLELVIAY